MHGRPFLRIASVSPLTNLLDRLDDSVDVRLYWHPEAYFANEFFLKVLWKLGGWDGTGKSKQCVRVALGDEGRSEENEIIIYGQLIPSSSTVRFHVTRLLPVQANPGLRPPRPDDPLPRREPIYVQSIAPHLSPPLKV
ncbi:hypothetical protein FRB99_005059 [Tulasnella sp. 403]|nr:hypothetical protein FRB99_005059 [Tulasnella sp. 403]